MIILDRKAFLALPAGVVFQTYEPCVFGEMQIKGDTWGEDFLVLPMDGMPRCHDTGSFQSACEAMEHGIDIQMDLDSWGRDGYFEEDEKYAVWSREDMAALKKLVDQTLANYP